MRAMRYPSALAAAVLLAGGCAGAATPSAPGPLGHGGYVAIVASESADEVSRVRFVPGRGAAVESRRAVGFNPTDVEGPHGVAVSPDGRHYFVSLAHGTPYGYFWKLETATNEVVDTVTLGLFPATIGVTPDGEYGFVSNFNLHGDPVPSSVSKVHLPSMTEVARTETCVMPHGNRVDPTGARDYSVCMMDDLLVEIDVESGEVARFFSMAPGRERPVAARATHAMDGTVCSPTWAEPSADGAKVYVACNRNAEILEIDVADWRVTRRFATGEAPYNLAVSPDGRLLLATLKNRNAPATEVIDLASGETLARVTASAVLPHGVSVTTDSRYAFVSVEGVGSQPGRVDVIDLESLRRVASVDVAPQAGGIAVVP